MVLRSPLLDEAGFAHAFGTRDTTPEELARATGTATIVQVKQVHGARVVEAVTARDAEADAIVARGGSGVAVAVRVADCVPILLGHRESGDVAAVHAGWRGVVALVVPAAVNALGTRGIVAAIGPCIGGCCFEVGSDVAEAVLGACGEARAIASRNGGKAFVDLRAAVRAQLRGAGVDDAHIEDVAGCTKHSSHFHSYRRDQDASGRMIAAIAARRSTPRPLAL